MGLWLGGRVMGAAAAMLRRVARQPGGDGAGQAADEGVTRRQVMGAAVGSCVVALPMLATLGSWGVSMPQKRRFRIREITVRLPQLPLALDGMTIAHLSDTHVGKFTRGAVLDRIVRQANELRADMVVSTGDLIDHSIRDLPEAMRMLERIDAGAGLPLLLDEGRTVYVRGQAVRLLGLRWHHRGGRIEPHVETVAGQREPGAFHILLAHHPHAFDHAAEHGIPLTLAGHTHGGQLMVTRQWGPGPAMFRYWSGLYERGDNRLVVSNGTGNWFPLRTNAPAEILLLTLRRA
jgi:predicted MPP superfamily phosphohydrolase